MLVQVLLNQAILAKNQIILCDLNFMDFGKGRYAMKEQAEVLRYNSETVIKKVLEATR